MSKSLYLFSLFLSLSVIIPQAGAQQTAIGSVVMVQGGVGALSLGSRTARRLMGSRQPIYLNERITTDGQGHVQILFLDDTLFTLGPKSSMVIDKFIYDPGSEAGKVSAEFTAGFFRFVTGKIAHHNPASMKVKLPIGTIGVFGTDVAGEIRSDRSTVILKDGRISVENEAGRTWLLHPDYATSIVKGEAPSPAFKAPPEMLDRLNRALDIAVPPSNKEVKPDGSMKTKAPSETKIVVSDKKDIDDFKMDVKNEVALGLSKDAVQAAAAIEARLAEYQEGKTMIDVFGKRVRLEEYILRPQPDEFKFVVLNERADSFNYFYYLAQFNQTLPTLLAPALRYLNGKTGVAPDFFIVNFETGRSNTIDAVKENGSGGHLVNTPIAADTVVYDAGSNTFNTVLAGTPFWSTLFNNYSYKIDGTEKFGWQPNGGVLNITAYDYSPTGINTRILGGGGFCGAAGCATAAPVTCTAQTCEDAARPSSVTQPEGSANLHDRATINYAANGTQETYDFYIVGDTGKLATTSDFYGITTGADYKNTLLKFNFEQVISASEFNGRKIDLVVEPKILVNSGVIQ